MPRKRSQYPEHDKLAKIQSESQAIGEFLEWLGAPKSGIVLAEWLRHITDSKGVTRKRLEPVLVPTGRSIETILARYFKIDPVKLEAEKRAMLAGIRSAGRGTASVKVSTVRPALR